MRDRRTEDESVTPKPNIYPDDIPERAERPVAETSGDRSKTTLLADEYAETKLDTLRIGGFVSGQSGSKGPD